jgi:hypothetical protein
LHRYAPALVSPLPESFFSSRVISRLRAVNVDSGRNNRRIKTRRKARVVAALVAGLWLSSLAGHAQDSTWSGGSGSNAPPPIVGKLWGDRFNWAPTPGAIPGPTGTATFDAVPQNRLISTLGGVSVGTLQFNAPNYTFDVPDALTINGTGGINASLANAPVQCHR